MSDYTFDLATPADDAAIRRLLAHNPVPGRVTLTYQRDPDYFLGCAVMGDCQVIVARYTPTGDVVGVANRAIRPMFVNGQIEPVGYIGQLRVDAAHSGRWVVAGGFRFFHELHRDGRTRGYITTIVEGNQQAQGVLVEKARRHYPAYRPIGRLRTLAIILRSTRFAASLTRRREGGQVTVRVFASSREQNLDQKQLHEISSFLHTWGAGKQFFPVFETEDFVESPTTRGFDPHDFIVARRGADIVGVLGLWSQSAYKQTVVQSYSGALRYLRPFYNATAPIWGAQPLAAPGQAIDSIYASFICVADDDPAVFAALLDRAYTLAAQRGYAYLVLGLVEDDPLLAVAKKYAHIPYVSTIYTVCWAGDESFHDRLDGRPIYLELATL